MDSIINKIQLSEKRYRDRSKKGKKEFRLNTEKHKKHKKQNKNRETEEDLKKYNQQLRKTKKKTK